MAQLSNTFEGGSNGTNITIGNSGGASGDAFNVESAGAGADTITYDNTRVAHGSLAMKLHEDVASSDVMFVEWDVSAITDFYGRMYFNIDLTPVASDMLYDAGTGGADKALIGFDASSHIILQDSTLTTKATSTATVSIDTWHRIDFHIVASTTVGQIEAKLFLGANFDGDTPDETVTTAANLNTGASITQHLFGYIVFGAGVHGQNLWMDDLVANATAYPGPVVAIVKPFVPHRMPLGV